MAHEGDSPGNAMGVRGNDNRCDLASGYSRERENVLGQLFTYHAPSGEQLRQYAAVRTAAKYFAEVILNNTPVGADQSAAIRKVREAVMTANAAIALRGLSF